MAVNAEYLLSGEITSYGTFDVSDFVKDLCKLGSAYEYYDVLMKVRYNHDVAAGRALYYEGRICDSMPFLEKFRRFDNDEQYLCEFNKEYKDLMSNVLDMFPDIRWRLKMNPKSGKIEMGADVQSVFDIAWYTFARMVADVAPPVDEDLDYHSCLRGLLLSVFLPWLFFLLRGLCLLCHSNQDPVPA